MQAPATLDEFDRTFPTERRCWETLRRLRWPGGFRCPRCEGRKAHRLRGGGLWPCAECRYQASLTAGTPFHGTRVPLRTWFLARFFVARHKQGISALQFQRDAGLGSYKTAWMLLHKVRPTLAHNPLFPLEGDVEVDETYVGGYRPGRNGRGVGKTGVVIAVERREKTAGSVRLSKIPRATRVVLNSFVQSSIRSEDTTVFTDAWGSYKALAKLGIDHLQRYFDEFSYRFDRRGREGELFGFVLRRVAGGQPLPYRRLVAEGTASAENGLCPAEFGLFGANLSGYGCAGMNNVAYGLVMQELERGDSGLRSFASVQGSLCMYPVHAYGSDAQKERWLPAIMRTKAESRGGAWVLNGTKRWITNGTHLAAVWARTDAGPLDQARRAISSAKRRSMSPP